MIDNLQEESSEYTVYFKSNGTATVGFSGEPRDEATLTSYSFIGINSFGVDNAEVLNASRNPSYDLLLAWYNLSPLGAAMRHMIQETGSLDVLDEDFGKVFAPPLVV